MVTEEFKVIPDYPKYSISKNGTIIVNKNGFIKKQHINSDGRICTSLYLGNNIYSTRATEDLIKETF